jgi:beta-galactosidase
MVQDGKRPFPRYLLHGADYNYEQWLDEPGILADDFRLMKEARCNVMSVGIFSWAMLEPDEGQFEFGWLDRLMDSLTNHEIHAILATPSGARPAWLSHQYPEVRRVDPHGRREPHRDRHNHCRTSPVYREKCRIINTRLAERYQDHPALLMWHVSNEYNGGACHCDLCYGAFREWLKARYGTLDALNKAWWTTFWSHRYTAWEQIEPVDDSIHGLMLDWQRFLSDQTLDFFLAEARPLRDITPHIPITTNFMRPDVGLDYWQFAPHVDVIAWDSYPAWHSGDDTLTAITTAFLHDLHRSYRQGQPFLLMESTPSVVNWHGVSRPKRPGMHKLSSLQAVAHGADSVQYFQWRQSRGSFEKFHGAVLGHAGHPHNRVFRDVSEVGDLLVRLHALVGTTVQPEVAVIYDFQNGWALDLAQLPRSIDKNYQQTCIRHYAPFWRCGIPVDVIDSTSDFSPYKLVIAPMLYMLRADIAERLGEFVRNGGAVVATYLTGLVDDTDLCFMADAPGPLRSLFGIWREEQDILHEGQTGRLCPVSDNVLTLSGSYSCHHYADVIHTEGAQVLAEYDSDFYQGRPALTVNRCGRGEAYYIASRNDDTFLTDFYSGLARHLALRPVLACDLPDGVTAQVRQSDSSEYVFLMNFAPDECTIDLGDESYTDTLTGAACTGAVMLEGYGIRIFERARLGQVGLREDDQREERRQVL